MVINIDPAILTKNQDYSNLIIRDHLDDEDAQETAIAYLQELGWTLEESEESVYGSEIYHAFARESHHLSGETLVSLDGDDDDLAVTVLELW